MKFSAIAIFVAIAASASAVPTGNTFMKRECGIARTYLQLQHLATVFISPIECVAALAPSVVACVAAAAEEGASEFCDHKRQ